MDFMIELLAKELSLRPSQVNAAVELLDAGNTIPFIARYRKEATGSLDDQVLRQLSENLEPVPPQAPHARKRGKGARAHAACDVADPSARRRSA